MSALVDRRNRCAPGSAPLLEARRAGDFDGVRAMAPALAQGRPPRPRRARRRVRAEEVGDVVRVYANVRPRAERARPSRCIRDAGRDGAGTRAPARGRGRAHLGPRAADVRVDWSRCGLELAQVALGFGANELVGPIANKRGLADRGRRDEEGEGGRGW